jgi:hypothetical protein
VTIHPSQTGALDPSERAELERLRAEVARLRASSDRGQAPGVERPKRRRRWWRVAAAVVLIVISCALSPLSVVAVWARGEVTDTNRYVETVAPLASDPAVQEAITTDITNTVFRYIDVQGLTQQAFAALAERGSLPPNIAAQLQALAVPVANGVRSFAEDQVRKVVQSDAFARAWAETNRAAHQQLVATLSGEGGGSVRVEGNAVKLDMAAFLAVVKQRLIDSGFALASRIPAVNATFVIFESEDVGKVQRGYNLLEKLGFWLPFILVALAALGIYAAPNHRLAFIGVGMGVALAMLVAGAALAVGRRAYLDGVPTEVLPPDAAAVLFDTVVRFLREAIRAAFLIGLLVALGAFLTGPSTTAVTIRRWLVAGFAAAKGGLAAAGVHLDGVTRWVAPRAQMFRVLVVAVAFGVLLLERYRTLGLVGWLTVWVLAGLAVVQFLAAEPRPMGRARVEAGAPAAVQGS